MNSRDLIPTADRAGPTVLLPVGPATHGMFNQAKKGHRDAKYDLQSDWHQKLHVIQGRRRAPQAAQPEMPQRTNDTTPAGSAAQEIPAPHSESRLGSCDRLGTPLASRGGDKAEAPILWTPFKARHNEPWRAV